jgi:hypothetical protein
MLSLFKKISVMICLLKKWRAMFLCLLKLKFSANLFCMIMPNKSNSSPANIVIRFLMMVENLVVIFPGRTKAIVPLKKIKETKML